MPVQVTAPSPNSQRPPAYRRLCYRKTCVFLSLLYLVFAQPTLADNTPPPNILIILADDLGFGDLSSYGATDLQSPNIDALLESGMRFDNFYANCPVCSPTRASLLTGRYPELVGVPGVIRTHATNNWGYLAPNAVLLPELLQRAGYDTALIGKWHLGLADANHPNERGFDHFHGFLGDMMDDYYKHRRHGINYMRLNKKEIGPSGHASDLFTAWARDYLMSRSRNDKPFLLYLAYNAPHTPIQPPQEWIERVQTREAGIHGGRSKLVALIEHMDQGIGQVMNALREAGHADDTLVIFTSDNGGQLNVGAHNGHHRDGKQSMYEGGLKVPTCITWPNRIVAGSRCNEVALTMDLFSTICEAANAKVDHKVDGLSLLPLLLEKQHTLPTRDVFFHRREGGQRYGGLTIQAVRRGHWKLLQNSPFASLELYNLATDPLEQSDLADKEAKHFRQLSAALRLQIQRGGSVPWQRPQRRDE